MSAEGSLEVAALAARHLERLGIPYVIVGSVASSFHGEPRATLDVDLTVRMGGSQAAALCKVLEKDFFIDLAAVKEAVRKGLTYNAVHRSSHVKLDLYFRRNEGIHAEELRRAKTVRLTGVEGSEAVVASAEDTVLQKLVWYRKGGEVSDRQWRDVVGVLKTRGANLDRAYLDEWAPRLEVLDLLERAMREARSPPQ